MRYDEKTGRYVFEGDSSDEDAPPPPPPPKASSSATAAAQPSDGVSTEKPGDSGATKAP